MAGDNNVPPRKLEVYREYLRLLAQLQLPTQFQGKLDASDIAQEALLKAHERWDQFRGTSDGELAAWLRRVLTNQLTDVLRKLGADKRDAGLELSLEKALDDSALRLEQLLAVEGRSPRDQTVHQEDLLKLSQALAELPEDQRTALEKKHLHGWSVDEISRHLHRSKTAVGGLLRRGMRTLREILKEPQ